MKIENFNVEVSKIAEDFYWMFADDEQASVSFGMLPAKKMKILEDSLGNVVEEYAKDICKNYYGFRPENNIANKELKKNFVTKAMHEISAGIFKYAKSIGKMIV